MIIKEHDEQHMVIAPQYTRLGLIISISLFGLAPIVIIQFIFSLPWNLMLALVFTVFIIRWLVHAGTRFELDKTTQFIKARQSVYWLFFRQHYIPFSDVTTIDVGSKIGKDMKEYWWISLDISGGKKIEFDRIRKEADAEYMAEQVINIIGFEQAE